MKQEKVLKSSIIVMLLIIIGKVLALIRDALIASKFGASYITDIYMFAMGIVYLLTTVSYALTTTFIPIHTEKVEKNKDKNGFANNVMTVWGILSIIFTVILIIVAKYIIYIFGHGFASDIGIFNQTVKITKIMLLSLIFLSLQSVITGVLQSHKQFLEPAAMAAASNIVFIVYLIFMADKYGIVGFAVATVVGFFVQFVINIPKYKKIGYKYEFRFNLKDRELKNMFVLMIPVIISTSMLQLNLFINRAFATNIFEGAVTSLDFANKINTLAYEVFAIGISMVVYPTLSAYAAQGKSSEYKNSLIKAVNVIFLIMVPASIAIAVLRLPLINIIFKRGAFDNDAAVITAQALLFYCPAMIAYGVRDILNKAFYSVKDTKTPMINSFLGILINILLNILLIKTMKVAGLALATSLSAVVVTIFMIINLNKKLHGLSLKKMFKSFIRISISALIMGIFVFIINKACLIAFTGEMKYSIFSIIFSFIGGSIVYFIAIFMLKVEEAVYFVNLLKGKVRHMK